MSLRSMREEFRSALQQVDRQAWMRFFVGILGLVLAFAAAVLSTSARQAGNFIASVILASSALVIATVVGVVTVPYLARRVVAHRISGALDYDVTREGGAYIVFTVLIAVGALNTGNNLLFIVVSAMIAAILVSGVASASVLTSVEVEMELPQHLFARQQYRGTIVLRNIRRFTPVFSVTVQPPSRKEKGKLQWRRSSFSFPPRKDNRKPWFSVPDMSLTRETINHPADVLTERVYFPFIAPRHTERAEVDVTFARRGRYVQDAIAISSRFPFSFLVKTRTIPLQREIDVYPPVDATDEMFEVLPMITGEFESYMRGRGNDLYRIRPYSPEDSVRHVDWKSSAKSGELMVREFTREDERRLRIVWDTPRIGAVRGERFEAGVELAASLAWHFSQENAQLSFAAPGYEGSENVYDFLRHLATTAPVDSPSVLASLAHSDDYNVIITAERRGSIDSRWWQSSYFVFLNG